MKDQFPLRPGLILMNAANLCPSPYPVSGAVFQFTHDVDADASFQNRGKFNDLHEAALEALGRYMGADADEVVITRNTSEGNNMVIAGLDLDAGDEVVLYEKHHIGCAVMGSDEPFIRFCPHIYNTMDEGDRVVEVIKGMV